MRMIKILMTIYLTGLCLPVSAQRLATFKFGDYTWHEGSEEPNLWVNPPIVDTVEIEDADTFVFDTHERNSPYAPYAFDTAVATATGWYRYQVREPYHNGLRIDSLFVRFVTDSLPDDPLPPDTTLPRPPVPPSATALIVNLVVVDHRDLSRFRILNLDSFDRAALELFDPSGKAIYKNRDYHNDFDFAGRKPGTYYYHLRLHQGGKASQYDGFVEVIHHK